MIDKEDLAIRKHMKQFIQQRLDEMEWTQADLAVRLATARRRSGKSRRGLSTPSVAFRSSDSTSTGDEP